MTTAIDTNVIVALWDGDEDLSSSAQAALERAARRGGLVVAAPVFSELMAAPKREEAFAPPRGHRDDGPRRILADFLIGAHALQRGAALLTLDDRVYRAAFPNVRLVKA